MRALPSPGEVVVGESGLGSIAGVMDRLGLDTGRSLVVLGQGVVSEELIAANLGSPAHVMAVTRADIAESESVAEMIGSSSAESLVAVGGGRTIDVGKYAASLAGIPFVSVATNLAHDGIASPVAVLEVDGRRRSLGAVTPQAVVIDLSLAGNDPRSWRAGVADVVSNVCALADWQLAAVETGERTDGLAESLSRVSAEAVLHTARSSGSIEFLDILARALVMSGMAMSVAGTSRPCSGADHEISHAMDELYSGDRLHGEQAAVGAMFVEFLRSGGQLAAIDECFRLHGVPRLPEDIGLTREEFAHAVHHAPGTRPDRYTLLEYLDLDLGEIKRAIDELHETLD
jgi:glycerol-1-phosphate dehydrogenase [NAD(P)+]